MMGQTKQHYIPQCYLHRFTDDGIHINTYDKVSSKEYRVPVSTVCCINDLYTLSDEFVEQNNKENGGNINKFSIEKDLFSKDVEPLYSQYLSQLDGIKEEWISGRGRYRLTYEEKKELALHLAIQYLRHPVVGDAEVDNYMKLEQAGLDMLKEMMAIQTGEDEFRKLDVKAVCEKPALHAKLTYMDYDSLLKCAGILAKFHFVFWISKDDEFYTTDFPVTVEPHVKDSRCLYGGLVQYGGEVMIPLSPSLSVSLYDYNYFKNKQELDGCFIEAGAKEVRRQNLIKYFYASRQVFSLKNDFSLIKSYCQVNGGEHVFMKPHLKAEVVSGLGRY